MSFGAVKDGAQAPVLTILRVDDLEENFDGRKLSSAHLAKPPPLISKPNFLIILECAGVRRFQLQYSCNDPSVFQNVQVIVAYHCIEK